MIKTEAEIRIALQAVLVSVLALTGYWGCALMVLLLMVPWKPIFAVGGYLAQPVVDWRVQNSRDRQRSGLEDVEKELDAILHPSPVAANPLGTGAGRKVAAPVKPTPPTSTMPFQPLKHHFAGEPNRQKLPPSAQDLAATMAIPPAIRNHVRNLPQGVFSNMNLEVQEVKVHGEIAEAFVRFKSSNVSGLVLHQCYLLRKKGEHWEVESRKPTHGGGKPLPQFHPPIASELRAS